MRIAMPLRYCMFYFSCASAPLLHNKSFISYSSHLYSNLVLSRDSKEVLVLYYYYIGPFTYFQFHK